LPRKRRVNPDEPRETRGFVRFASTFVNVSERLQLRNSDAGLETMTSGFLAEELHQIIAQATAPAFLLGAVAGFLSVLIGRSNRIVDRSNYLSAIEDDDPVRGRLKTDIPRLRRRAKLVNRAIEFVVISGVFTTCLVVVAFASAVLGFSHVYGAAVLFVLALGFFAAALISLWIEVRIALGDLDYYG